MSIEVFLEIAVITNSLIASRHVIHEAELYDEAEKTQFISENILAFLNKPGFSLRSQRPLLSTRILKYGIVL